MSLPVIICRAQPGARESAAHVKAVGLDPIISPALSIRGLPETRLPPLHKIGNLVFTSANGVRAFSERSDVRDIPAWCVGPATAAAAKNNSFTRIHESAGNAVDLANYILAHAQPDQRSFLHVANSAAKGDLKAHLEAAGRRVIFAPLYETVQVAELSGVAKTALLAPEDTILLVHSHKGANAFLNLAEQLALGRLHVIAISDLAASPFFNVTVSHISIASVPNEEALIKALQDVAATLSA